MSPWDRLGLSFMCRRGREGATWGSEHCRSGAGSARKRSKPAHQPARAVKYVKQFRFRSLKIMAEIHGDFIFNSLYLKDFLFNSINIGPLFFTDQTFT
jgi:hypothetical protein